MQDCDSERKVDRHPTRAAEAVGEFDARELLHDHVGRKDDAEQDCEIHRTHPKAQALAATCRKGRSRSRTNLKKRKDEQATRR